VQFNADQFVKTLQDARVNGVNVFAKCHHGMSYYPTKVGRMHPSLKFDLLGQMLRVLKQEGIQAVVYFPVGWEEDAADREEWLEVPRSGIFGGIGPFEERHYKWRKLCLNKPGYIRFIQEQTAELFEQYKFDGLWYDIIFQQQCVCCDCISSMKALGLNPQLPADVMKHDFIALKKFQQIIFEFVQKISPDALVTFNGNWSPDRGDDETYSIRQRMFIQTHLEIESLPSELWGYNHFPLLVNYHNRYNAELVGMNGKFHTAWGDFGSLRNDEALEFECFRMIANGTKVSIGDQLHPRGKLDEAVYERIGRIYEQIEAREPWCVESYKVSQIGVLMSRRAFDESCDSDEGAMRMLLELHYSFDLVDEADDFSRYELIILPDHVICTASLADKISSYLQEGGKVIASYHSGLNVNRSAFELKEWGVQYEREADYQPCYLLPGQELIEAGTAAYEYALYEQGAYVQCTEDALMLAELGSSYFNRSYDRFSSHRHSPYDKPTGFPAIISNGPVMYYSHPLFTDYIRNGVRVYREWIQFGMDRLLLAPLIITDLPVSAEVTVRAQNGRLIIHLLHYIAERKSRSLDIVDTKIPLYNHTLKVKTDRVPSRVYATPSMQDLFYQMSEGYIVITVPELVGHMMVVVEQ
jgi:hypothetical protein